LVSSSRFRVSGVTALAVTVLLLLPALAWLQYSWLDQIAVADRERRERTVQTAVTQLAADLDGELSRAFTSLQLDGVTVERAAWNAYAQRYSAWAATAANAGIVEAVYFAELPRPAGIIDSGDPRHGMTGEPAKGRTTLRRWDPQLGTFEERPWPVDLAEVRARVEQQVAHFAIQGVRRGDRLLSPPMALGDERTLVAPIMHIDLPEPGALPSRVPDVRLLGFSVIRLDPSVIRDDVLPALVRRHFFDADGHTEYRVAVVQREQPDRIVYESEPGAAQASLSAPDATVVLMSARMRPMFMMARGERRAGGSPAPPSDNVVVNVIETRRGERGAMFESRVFNAAEGHWRLAVKHRAGSLEAAVAATRTRNFALSSGVLALLAAAIGLLVVSARRADRLARQQMEFVAAVSHELRTPVAVIGAAAGNLADGVVGDAARVKKYGAAIQGEARRLGETVERVLQLAGVAAGHAAARRELVAPADLIAGALEACRAQIEGASINVEVDVSDDLPKVAGDAAALRSAVQNLVSNAVKYGREAQWLRVSAREEQAGRTRRAIRRWQTAGPAVLISVEDRGPGIAPDDRKHIFDAFYRGHDAVARQIQGTGLGLNLVRRIAEAHGGAILVASEPGRGSTFTLRLPAADEHRAESIDARETDPAVAGFGWSERSRPEAPPSSAH
jgi:signal transduction histidine kinase